MAGSLKYGQATASLVVGKWSAATRQNTLAAALKEWGTLRRTIHAARYLSDPAYRRKIGRQLNKGESLHALRRDLHYAHQGTVGKPHLADQSEQAWCLTVLTNSVITWTTEYYQLAVQQLRGQGRDVPDEILVHISPAHSERQLLRRHHRGRRSRARQARPGRMAAAATRRTGSEPAAVTSIERPLLMNLRRSAFPRLSAAGHACLLA